MRTRGKTSSVAVVARYTNPIPPGTQTYDVSIDKLRSETKKYETAYDALVRGGKGTGS